MIRFFSDFLKEWKNTNDRKPLIVRGARQVGKSYCIETFGKENFASVVVVDFEKSPQVAKVFAGDLDAKAIVAELELIFKVRIQTGTTLVFFDEIQKCPRAITALRYFYEQWPKLAVIAAGSLLDFVLNEVSIPVGRVSFATLYPLSFAEFLVALGEEGLFKHIQSGAKISLALHEKLLALVRTYMIVGGMPRAVATYLSERSFLSVQRVHSELVESYKQDFAKYAGKARYGHLLRVIEKLPQLVGQQVKYVNIDRDFKPQDLKEAILLLERTHVIHRVRATSGDGLPLAAKASDKYFKTVVLDIGIMQRLAGIDWATVAPDAELTTLYEGALAEQFVGQELMAASPCWQHNQLFYWRRDAVNASAEVDYLIVNSGQPCPVEVKSAKKGRLKSLHLFRETYHPPRSFVVSSHPLAREESLEWVPFYAVPRLVT